MLEGVDTSSDDVEFVVAVGRPRAATLVREACDEDVRVARVETVEAAPSRRDDEPVDCLVVDASADWRSLVADREPAVPAILLATADTPVEEAVRAGFTDAVRRSDPAAETLLAARLARLVDARRDRAEEARRREWLETVARHASDSMSVVAQDGRAVYNTPAVEDQLGYAPEELRGQDLFEQIHPDDRQEVQARFEDVLEQPDGTYTTATYRRRHADGSWRWIEAVANVQLDNPQIGGVIVNRRDVTEREEQRQQLRDQEAYVESLLDAQPDVFYTLDADGFFQEWNARLSTVLGYDDEALEELHAVETIVPDDREMIMDAMTTVYQDREPQLRETAFLTADGDRIPYQLNGAPLTDSDGEVIGLVGTGRDISGQVRREERLSVLNRVLRHNLRNRTNVVIGRARELADRLDDPTAVDHAETIREVGLDLDRLGVLARKVDRALDGRVDTVTLDPATVVTEVADDVPESVQLSIEEPPAVELSALGSFADALGEVVDNAVRHNPADEPRVEIAFSVQSDRVAVHVADDGPPIPDQEIGVLEDGESRLEHGGGLGLWFVNWVVDASGGELSFGESAMGGNRVTLVVPRADN